MTPQPKRIRVVLADDHTLFRKGVSSLLAGTHDMEVVAEVDTGEALLKMLDRLSAPPDVCLLDVRMPGMGGYETLLALKARYPDVRVIILTMLESDSVILPMIRAGASGYLLKETDPEELTRAIRHVAAGETFFHSELVAGAVIHWMRNGAAPHNAELTERERHFLKLCTTDMAYKEMSTLLGITVRAVEGLRTDLCDRLQIKSRAGLAMYAVCAGLAGP